MRAWWRLFQKRVMRNKLGIYALITNLLAEQIYINNPKRLRHVMCSVRAENQITLYSNMRFNSFYRRCKIYYIIHTFVQLGITIKHTFIQYHEIYCHRPDFLRLYTIISDQIRGLSLILLYSSINTSLYFRDLSLILLYSSIDTSLYFRGLSLILLYSSIDISLYFRGLSLILLYSSIDAYLYVLLWRLSLFPFICFTVMFVSVSIYMFCCDVCICFYSGKTSSWLKYITNIWQPLLQNRLQNTKMLEIYLVSQNIPMI